MSKTTIAIPYYSGQGHTKRLAAHVQEGIQGIQNVESKLLLVTEMTEHDWDYLMNATGIVFGSPTYMGSVAAKYKTFMEELAGSTWVTQKLANKVGAAFTIGTYPAGDKLSTLQQLSVFAAQHSMIWVGQNEVGSRVTQDGLGINADGAWLGLSACSSPDKTQLIDPIYQDTARRFGQRIAKTCVRWNSFSAT